MYFVFRLRLLLLLAVAGLSAPVHLTVMAADPRRDATVEAVGRVMPAVVNIGTETIVETRGDPLEQLIREFFDPYYRHRAPDSQYSLGSGVIIDEAGYVLTNDHVVRRASRIWVKLSEDLGGRVIQADRVASQNKTDIALLKLRAKPGERFPAVKFAGDDDLLLGETVLALGNPFGLGGSVSRGILSSKNRRPPAENLPLDVADWLQTDAAINPGNSGGPLINLRGELIGLNVAVFREGQGIGFAIPIKRVTSTLAELVTPEATKSLWFGAQVKVGGNQLTVLSVQPGSPAEKAGLRKGQVILQVNGVTPKNFIEFNQELTALDDKRDIPLVVQEGTAKRLLQVRLVQEKDYFNADLIQKKLGMSLQEISPEQAQRLGLRRMGGFIITGVDKTGPAADAHLQRNLIVQAIDGQTPPSLTEAAKLVNGKKKGEKIELDVLLLRRQGSLLLSETGSISLVVR